MCASVFYKFLCCLSIALALSLFTRGIAASASAGDFTLDVSFHTKNDSAIAILKVSDFSVGEVDDASFSSNGLMTGKDLVVIRLNKDGIVKSSNPVWNACIRGKATLGLIRHNTDRVLHRQGRIRTYRPKSCDAYHRNSFNVWKHPDFADLHLTLDKKGHLVGGVPSGYIVSRDRAEKVADQDSTIASN